LERPQQFAGLVDLPPDGSDEHLAGMVVAALDGCDGEDQTAWRDGERFVPRLLAAAKPSAGSTLFRADATYLISGGFGGIGLLIARWMAEHGARHIALLGRHPDIDSDAVQAITALGAHTIPLAADVADAAAMQAAFARLADAPRLRGIMHAAAEFGAAPIGGADDLLMQGTLRPKIDGTLVLEELSRGYELDFFVLFSSAAAVLGAANYAHYAAANAFLDATAATGRLNGRPVISANWGAWQASAGKERTFREGGLEPMTAETTLDALARMLSGRTAPRIIGHFDWSVLKPLLTARASRPMLSRLAVAQVTDRPTPPSKASDSFADMLNRTPAAARPSLIAELVRKEVAAVLGLSPDDAAIEPQAGFFDLGMDSLTSVELRRRLEVAVGRSLPSTLTFNYPTLSALSGFLAQAFDEASAPAEEKGTFAPSPPNDDDLADLSASEIEVRLLARLQEVQ
jgi:NAD(P)-dependent dehydrogenase (short-subunit alcohol dehydrogenase family)/acyl carrier protein